TCSPGAQGSTVQAPGADLPLKRVRGASVLFHVSRDVGAELEEITWSVGPESNYTNMLQVHRGQEDAPTWVNLRDKYEHRVHVPNMMSLEIENLSPEDSGWYRAQAQLPRGRRSDQGFQLTVYEPAPVPQILTESASITPDWCNITLGCRTTGDREHVSVKWKSNFSPAKSSPGPAPNSWVLAVSLPLSQPNASLTCVVSNPVEEKTHSTTLGEVCAP
ncbi:T-lymphocyte surface antigen Ly-9, partial [Galemys pyrenaicus]